MMSDLTRHYQGENVGSQASRTVQYFYLSNTLAMTTNCFKLYFGAEIPSVGQVQKLRSLSGYTFGRLPFPFNKISLLLTGTILSIDQRLEPIRSSMTTFIF